METVKSEQTGTPFTDDFVESILKTIDKDEDISFSEHNNFRSYAWCDALGLVFWINYTVHGRYLSSHVHVGEQSIVLNQEQSDIIFQRIEARRLYTQQVQSSMKAIRATNIITQYLNKESL